MANDAAPRLDETASQRPGFRWPADRPSDAPRGGRVPAAALPAAPPGRVAVLAALAGVGGAVWLYLMPPAAGLSTAGQASLAVFAAAATLWVTDVLPIGVTGLVAVALLGLTGALRPGDAYAAFGNGAVFFILGAFILAAALIRTGLSKRLALLMLGRFQRGPFALAAGMMVTVATLTVVMPAQATAAMFLPIATELALAMRLGRGTSDYAKVLFLALAWGTMVGSNASFLGSTRAPLALGLLASAYGETVTFTRWLAASIPVVVVGLAAGLIILRLAFPTERVEMAAARQAIADAVAELGPFRGRQVVVAAIVGLTVAGWIAFGGRVDLGAMAILGAAALFACGILRWPDLDGYVHWGIVLMYGGAIALGTAIERSGAAEFVVGRVLDGATPPPAVALAGLIVLTVLLTEFMSNAAAVAVMLPLAFTLSERVGVSPVAMVLACSTAAGLDFTFPFSSAPNSIVYASGYLRMRDMLGAGSVMTVAQVTLLMLAALFYWPLIGVR